MLIGNARCHVLPLLAAHVPIQDMDTALAIPADVGIWTALQMVALTIISLQAGCFAAVLAKLAWDNALGVRSTTFGSPRSNF
ncbi:MULTISPECIES: hypothetical protein [unclassified Bradyrhizobium]|uniref:hypothetical protein n=1 Tax=unclassified Bradyrhizobium TaxID=2631580 RepID=UPI001BAE2AC5|nr:MULTISPECIES: hypothetical protein [unclassified Bradyrhizobium]MBR1207456.1 hypothetical protein [Bradyrhizobium sp. AUGA SZCCT0124]MBR1315872.1 hypothetical protein [Bradyrhizobium sp. AUGA SZCCT0051]MBR1343978.1 hypothetical protein [Bradyrhizobium sp. AUGA SZCCT0105]MBR1358035.1 hypothetical protein [Bradyrhizobium sp. AUGA SZCCT0045]